MSYIYDKLEFPDKLNLAMSSPELSWLMPHFDSLVITNADLSNPSNYIKRLLDFEVTCHVKEIWVTSAIWSEATEDMSVSIKRNLQPDSYDFFDVEETEDGKFAVKAVPYKTGYVAKDGDRLTVDVWLKNDGRGKFVKAEIKVVYRTNPLEDNYAKKLNYLNRLLILPYNCKRRVP